MARPETRARGNRWVSMSRPAAADTASRRDGHWHCCINLYVHTTPLSAQIAEWYVHKELCSKTVKGPARIDPTCHPRPGKNPCSPGPMECTRLLTSSFSLHRFLVSRIQGRLIFAPSSFFSESVELGWPSAPNPGRPKL